MDYSNKNVMFITGSLSDGGAERVMSILASQCAEMGVNVSLVVLREKTQIYSISDKINVYQIKTNKKNFKTFDRIWQLHNIIKNSEAKTIIPFLPIVSLYTLIANIGVGKRIIMSERADPDVSIFIKNLCLKDRLGNLIMRKIGLFSCADWMVFQTRDAQKFYGKKLQDKSSIIHNPLDTENLPLRFEGTREKKVVAVGRLSEEKNFPLLIRAFSIFHKSHMDYSLVIYGEGHLEETLRNQILRLGIEHNVDMPGFVPEVTKVINNAAMYISTSNHEGISNSMLEALGMGVPTIVTDCPVGGAKMFVKTDINGILIPMNHLNDLVEAMNKIADDSEYANAISCEATKLREELSAKNICEEWVKLVK